MREDEPTVPVPSAMDHDPPDPPPPSDPPDHDGSTPLIAIPTPLPSSTPSLQAPAGTTPTPLSSTPTALPRTNAFLPCEVDPSNHELTISLERFQQLAAHATLSSSCGTANSSSGPAQSNLMLKVADLWGNAQSTIEEIAQADLSNIWRDRAREIDEVTQNLFLAGSDTEGDMMWVIQRQSWILHGQNLLIEICKSRNDDYHF